MAKFERVLYKGDDGASPARWFTGLPARDMTGEEWYARDADLREAALAAGVYEGVSAPSKAAEKLADVKPVVKPTEGGV